MTAEMALTIRPGLAIALISGLIALGLFVFVISDRRRKKAIKSARREVLERAKTGEQPRSNAQIDAIWSEAIKSMESLQEQMMGELGGLEAKLKSEREAVQAKAEAMKTLARENRIPLTLFELYEGMRSFHRKSPESRSADLEWHGKIGITAIEVMDNLIESRPGQEIHFTLDGEPYLLVGAQHEYSKTSFLELNLYDIEDKCLVTVRVQPDPQGRRLISEAVVAMSRGPWIQAMLACRAKMDTRHREVSLQVEHRDVVQLKEKFSIDSTDTEKTPTQ